MEVDLFIPCFVDQLYPDTGFNMVQVLRKAGCKVHYNPQQTCCGMPAHTAGYEDDAKEVAQKFISDFPGKRYIVSPSGACTGMVRSHYESMFHNTSLHNDSKRIRKRIFELADFLINIAKCDTFGAALQAKVTYHDGCITCRDLGVRAEPRQLLRNVTGLELIEMEESDACCGFGGTFATQLEAVSVEMCRQKVEQALATGAEYIVSADSSCLMQLQTYADKHEMPIKTIHLADVLASGWKIIKQ